MTPFLFIFELGADFNIFISDYFELEKTSTEVDMV